MTEWPGVHSGKAILEDKPLKGLWFSRTQEYAARNRGEDFGRLKYATEEELVLSPLPCWADRTPEEYSSGWRAWWRRSRRKLGPSGRREGSSRWESERF